MGTHPAFRRLLLTALGSLLFASCGGGGGGGDTTPAAPVACTTCSTDTADLLTSADVETVVAQAVGEAQARGRLATIAVSDRVGNVLAVFRMTGASKTVTVTSFRGVVGGLENAQLPDTAAAEAKAITGAYLSSNGNAFSTRTASQIVQENFNPGDINQPAGPLFGVQFSSLPCGDVVQSAGATGPHFTPLGLSAGPGGLPLYKGANVVGGVGVIADGLYTLDYDFTNRAPDVNEEIALAGTSGYAAPAAITADKISAGGIFLRYINPSSLVSNPANHAAFAALPGALVAAPNYAGAAVLQGQAFGAAASGIRPDTGAFAALNGYVLVDGNNQNRFPPIASTDGAMNASDVTQILTQALKVANHTRAQIRQPLNTVAQISITVVDLTGKIVGFVRTPDAPVFGIDVSVQKARTVLFFSDATAQAQLLAAPPANYAAAGYAPSGVNPITSYVTASQTFFANPAIFTGQTAWSARALGNVSRPYFPDGINGSPPGPLSKTFSNWSIFDDGLQLDLDFNSIVAVLTGGAPTSCTALPQVPDGIQIFAGGVPIYKNGVLIGAIGVSGDGTSQDDMVSFLGLANAATALNNGIGNAPAAIRADQLAPGGPGTKLLYVQCPTEPFIDTNQQNVCAGL